jgi:hypothetical protein
VTWLTRLLAGEHHCQWKAWFKAHNKHDKLPSDFDLATWAANHAKMVRERTDTLRNEGFEVYVEGQNDVFLEGNNGVTLSGTPDIVAVRNGEAVVVDCKTGTDKNSDKIQVLIYMMVLPHTHPACTGLRVSGEVDYSSGSVAIGADEVDERFHAHFREMIDAVGGDTELGRVPSWSECQWCDITSGDCPDRVEERVESQHTDLF